MYIEGSIPAWAGKPIEDVMPELVDKVYPRVGGETPYADFLPLIQIGLSPRGRGNPEIVVARRRCDWSIPAWAGKPRIRTATTPGWWVYPRVGGETSASF